MRYKSVKSFISKIVITSIVVSAAAGLSACSFKFKGNNIAETGKEAISSVLSDTEKDDLKSVSGYESVADKLKSTGETVASENDAEFVEASLVRIVDGDTIVVSIDNEDYKVRLIGINTPESVAPQEYLDKKGTENSAEGMKASDITKGLLEGVDHVYLEKNISETDKYGRLLRYVWLEVPDSVTTDSIAEEMLNGMLLTSGAEKVAEPVQYEPDIKYADEFEDIYENY